ncbi:MAG: hypothetical protein WKF37_01830 [Bryobacteraceae bacterium]
MAVPVGREEELEKLELQLGVPRGRLALALGMLTDSLVLAAQHGVYCQSSRQPGMPKMDIQLIVRGLEEAKGLIQDVMAE